MSDDKTNYFMQLIIIHYSSLSQVAGKGIFMINANIVRSNDNNNNSTRLLVIHIILNNLKLFLSAHAVEKFPI